MNDWVTKILSKDNTTVNCENQHQLRIFTNFEAGPTESGVKGNPPPFLIVGDPCSKQWEQIFLTKLPLLLDFYTFRRLCTEAFIKNLELVWRLHPSMKHRVTIVAIYFNV